jgi:hypothetical protein
MTLIDTSPCTASVMDKTYRTPLHYVQMRLQVDCTVCIHAKNRFRSPIEPIIPGKTNMIVWVHMCFLRNGLERYHSWRDASFFGCIIFPLVILHPWVSNPKLVLRELPTPLQLDGINPPYQSRPCSIASAVQSSYEAYPQLQTAIHGHRGQICGYPGSFQILQQIVVRDLPQRIFRAVTDGKFPSPPLPYVIQVQIPEYEHRPFGLREHPFAQCLDSPLDPTNICLAAAPLQQHAEQWNPKVTCPLHNIVDGYLPVSNNMALSVEHCEED